MSFAAAFLGVFLSFAPDSAVRIIEGTIHLRQSDPREWSTFPDHPEARAIDVRFELSDPDRYQTLRWYQEDVRRSWHIRLNGRDVAVLLDDETPQLRMVSVPVGVLKAGINRLEIATTAEEADDVYVGSIELLTTPLDKLLEESHVQVQVVDEEGAPTSARITVASENGALVPLKAKSDGPLAVRTGVVYAESGGARLHVPAGAYRIYASKGAAYEVDSTDASLQAGTDETIRLVVRQSVAPPGYVSVDTHVHTLSWSGHGDASVTERVLTVGGEGLDAVVLTEHNRHATLRDTADAMGVDGALFIPGNEFTTPVGHFNVFPVDLDATAPPHEVGSWEEIAAGVRGARIVVLNHGRDVHAGFAPLGPERFSGLSGERLDGASLPANAMEVWNSSAQRSDPFDLFGDWLALANRGTVLVPVGSSDSHDVSRYLLGQGRTWVRCPDCTGNDAVSRVVEAFAAGHVSASMGFVVEILVDGRPAAGELVIADDSVEVEARVWGPSWMRVDELRFFVNGEEARSEQITAPAAAGLKSTVRWHLPRPRHDVSVVALATGPAPQRPFWSIPRPYQRTSDSVTTVVAGTSGLVRIDADGDGRWTSPYDYALQTLGAHEGDVASAVLALEGFDRAVAVQAASILRKRGLTASSAEYRSLREMADETVRAAFDAYYAAVGDPQMKSTTTP